MDNNKKRQLNFFSWFRRNYMSMIIALLFFYLLLAFIAPVLMKNKITQTGRVIYKVYSNFCHQFAHRSWFLFGEQSYYPAYSEEGSGIKSFFDEFGVYADCVQESREIIGNESAGYKVAICQRDVAIYGAMLIFAILYKFSKNQIKKIPFWLWLLLAVFPMGVDGFWQFLSPLNTKVINISLHESTPIIRSITGCMFGLFTGWYLYPAIEETFKDESDGTIKKIDVLGEPIDHTH